MILTIKAKPNSKKNSLYFENNMLGCKIASPPTDGKANKCLLAYLSDLWHIPKSRIVILKGESSAIKRLEIDDVYGPIITQWIAENK
ncbi:MAG: DUF167 domain-containing protein [Bacteroidetes bacterium]|nr:DUF167 domain-containing protein [Bacteroidota bacterium]